MSKEDSKEDIVPKAYVSLSGQLLECNSEFLKICGLTEREVAHTSLTSLAKHKNPEAMLESAYLLDQLADAKGTSEWRGELGSGKETKNDDIYEITAKLSKIKLHGQTVLEATVISPHSVSVAESKKELPKYMKAQSEDITNFTPQRVLVVEDSPMSLKMMARMVQRLGHIVSTAVDGSEALEMLRSQNFDIVLMDINMPKMNGLEASHEFRQIERSRMSRGDPCLKIIAMSADISNTLFHEVTNAGFDTFIPKPLTVESFKDVLKLPTKYF
jgi:CheY-like chemotaxis protein